MIGRIISGTTAQFFGIGVSFFDRFVVTAVLLRYWGVGLFEDWSLLLAAVALVGIFDLGFQSYFGNAYLFAYERKEYDGLKKTVRLSIFFNSVAVVTGFAFLILVGLILDIHKIVGISNLDKNATFTIFIVLGLMVLLQAASAAITELYRAQGKFGRGVFIVSLLVLFRSAALALSSMLGAGLQAGAWVFLGLTVLFVFVIVPLDQKRSLRFFSYRPKIPSRSEIFEVLDGSKWYFVQHFPPLLQLNLPVLLIGNVKSAAGIVASFILSRTIINFARALLQNFSFVLGLEISRAYARTESDRVHDMFVATNRFICALTGAMLGCLLALSRPFFFVWTGGAVSYNEVLMVIFALTVGLAAPATSSVSLLLYIKKPRPVALGRISQTVITLVLAVALVRSYGVVGVALALLAGEVIGLSVFTLPETARVTDLSLPWLIASSMAIVMAGFLPCFIFGSLLCAWMEMAGLVEVVVGGIVLLPVFLLTVSFIGVAKSHRQFLWQKTGIKFKGGAREHG